MARQTAMFKGKINFLKIRPSDGVLYRGLKKDEYDAEVAKGNPFVQPYKKDEKDPNSAIYYHWIFTGGSEIGQITYLGLHEAEFSTGKVTYLSFTIRGEKESDNISVPLYKSNSFDLSPTAKDIIKYLPGIDFSRPISFSSFRPKSKNNEKTYLNIFFSYHDGEKPEFLKMVLHVKDEKNPNGQLPKPIETERNGKKFKDSSAQDAILYGVLQEQIARFNAFRQQNPHLAQSAQEPAQNVTQQAVLQQGVPQQNGGYVGQPAQPFPVQQQFQPNATLQVAPQFVPQAAPQFAQQANPAFVPQTPVQQQQSNVAYQHNVAAPVAQNAAADDDDLPF